MEYFRSLSSALGKSGGPLSNYIIDEDVESYHGQSIWTLHRGTRRSDSVPVSIFSFDQTQASRDQIAMAQNAIKRLRTTRYPHILKFLDATESQGTLYLVVERVEPLIDTMALWAQGKGRGASTPAWIVWGLSHIASALAFFHQNMHAVHGNVHPGSVFLAPSGEWLLGGMETLSQPSEPDALVLRLGGRAPRANVYAAPEVVQAGFGALNTRHIYATDSYSLCMLAVEAFNGTLPANTSHFPAGRIPTPLYAHLKRMAQPRPDTRLSVTEFLELGRLPQGFLSTNVLVQADQILEDFRVAHPVDKGSVLARLVVSQEQIAPSFAQFKVLPALVETFRYKGGSKDLDLEFSASSLLPLILEIGATMDSDAWRRVLSEPMLGAMASPYQPIRFVLMSNVTLYAHHLDAKAVSHQLWPLVWKSFQSTQELERTAAINSIRVLLPKFSERIRNNELLRELAKMQKDVRPLLRLQATQLLSEMSPRLTSRTKADVLIPAFACSLRDTFDETRLAGIKAFREAADNFDAPTAACHVVPALSPCLVDANAAVRDSASEALHFYLNKISEYTQDMSSHSVELPSEEPSSKDTEPTLKPEPRANKFASFLSATAGSAASRLGEWAMAQLEEDDALATQVSQSLAQPSKAAQSQASLTPDLLSPPAVPVHQASSLGMDLSANNRAEKVANTLMQSQPKKAAPSLTSKPREVSPITRVNAPSKTLSKEEKMAQLHKLREERRAVRMTD